MPVDNSILILVVGSAKVIDFPLVGLNDEEIDTSTATRATLKIIDVPGTSSPLVDVSTTSGELTISSGKVSFAPTQVQSDAWTKGTYTGALNIEFGAGNWADSERFTVKVREQIVGILP